MFYLALGEQREGPVDVEDLPRGGWHFMLKVELLCQNFRTRWPAGGGTLP